MVVTILGGTYRHSVGISTKVAYVVLNPFKCCSLISETQVQETRVLGHRAAQETQGSQLHQGGIIRVISVRGMAKPYPIVDGDYAVKIHLSVTS